MKRIYLAGSMALVSVEHAAAWRAIAKDEIRGYGLKAVSPLDFEPPTDAGVVDLDLATIRGASAVLVDGRQPGWGTAMEVFFAWSIGTPVVAWGIRFEDAPIWLRHHCVLVTPHMTDAIDFISQFAAIVP